MRKPSPFRYLLVILPVILIVVLAIFIRKEMGRIAGVETPVPVQESGELAETPVTGDESIQKALDEAVSRLKASDEGYAIYDVKIDNIVYADDGQSAMVWLAALEPDTGEVIAREPEIAVAKKTPSTQKGVADSWTVTLPYEADFAKVVDSMPKGLLGEDFEQRFQTKYAEPKVKAKFGGYLLPWAGGQTKRLTWSISHTSCSGSDCYYAFDFADGTMFPILAAKGGSVFAAKWTCTNGSTTCTNYIILKDSSTTPVSYQIYYHLANNSIPTNLRTVGAKVNQGTFIGNVDDTGASTAHHLHFMVHTASYGYWGPSVDITFKDVSINYDSSTQGGRPRTPTEASKYGGQGQTSYKSGNKAAKGPSGSITSPAQGSSLTSRNLTISGTGTDDKGVTKVQLIGFYNNAWHDIGNPVTSVPFNINLDVCASGAEIPDGPVSFALKLWDVEGNESVGLQGLTGIAKNFPCSNTTEPPPCVPTASQIALYSGKNYSGVCKVYSSGDYKNSSAMGGFAESDAESVLVGSSAQVTLWAKTSYQGRAETLVTSDPDLSDNIINLNQVSSFKVKSSTNTIAAPGFVSPASGATFTTDESISLAWSNGGWANEFQVELSGNNGFTTRTSEWKSTLAYNVGSLPVGSYTWKVRARNSANSQVSAWSSRSFTVKTAASPSPAVITAPWSDNVESGANGWVATGLWNRTTALCTSASTSWLFGETVSSVKQYSSSTSGTLTSPPINIPAAGYYLRFLYRYNTEGLSYQWDQRAVQISADGSPFVNVAQLYWDPENTWLQGPVIDLSAYANQSIRIRFYFNALDDIQNVGDGWYIDDVQISQVGMPTACNEPSANNSLDTASVLSLTQAAVGDICPGGDVDYYKFTANAGDRITFDIDAKTIGSSLDSVVTLYSPDGRTVLAENDDEIYIQRKDSLLYYIIPTTGEYKLKVQAWNHPMVGGSDYFYILRMYKDYSAPTIKIDYPASGTLLPNAIFNISVSGTDTSGSGIGHVVFYYHNHDWENGVWQKLGEDWNPEDGWNLLFDPTNQVKGSLAAIYAQVFDNSGNWGGIASWGLKTDPTQAPPPVPTSAMIPLPATSNLNTVLLQWTANNVGAGISKFEVQVKENGGTWQNWLPPDGIKVSDRYTWFIGQPGSTYGFRMRVIDNTGTAESWSDTPETTVQMSGCTAGMDATEADNSLAAAKAITVGGDRAAKTFCGQDDADWFKFEATAGEVYFINSVPLSRAVGPVLTLYTANGTPIAETFPAQLGSSATIRWLAPTSGTYYVKARNFNPLIAGDGATYQFWVDQGIQAFVPMIMQ